MKNRIAAAVAKAVHSQLKALESAQVREAKKSAKFVHDQAAELMLALKKAQSGKASAVLDVVTRSKLLKVVADGALQTSRGLAHCAVSAVASVAGDAASSIERFFSTVKVPVPPKVLKPSEQYTAQIQEMARRASGLTGIDLRNEMLRKTRQLQLGKDTVGDLIDTAAATMLGQDWRVSRLVATEAAFSYNAVAQKAITELSDEYPKLRMRWTELVSDLTGAPLDNRVGIDSIILHGQVARAGELFKMPDDPQTPKGLVGRAWMHPPNRPRDRSVLVPWMPGWSVPAWVVDANGKRRPL